MRFCVDCQHHRYEPPVEPPKEGGPGRDEQHICTGVMDMVTGQVANVQCWEARLTEWQCGREAHLFKQRGQAEKDPRKEHGMSLDLTGGRHRDKRPGRSDD
jgi:hypothetical protein